MTPELSHACSLIIDAHEAAELAVIVARDEHNRINAVTRGGKRTPNADQIVALAAAAEQDAQTVLDAITPVAAIARQAMERDADRPGANHPALVALRGGA